MIKDSKKLAKDRFDATQKAKKEALSEYETQSLITREKNSAPEGIASGEYK